MKVSVSLYLLTTFIPALYIPCFSSFIRFVLVLCFSPCGLCVHCVCDISFGICQVFFPCRLFVFPFPFCLLYCIIVIFCVLEIYYFSFASLTREVNHLLSQCCVSAGPCLFTSAYMEGRKNTSLQSELLQHRFEKLQNSVQVI